MENDFTFCCLENGSTFLLLRKWFVFCGWEMVLVCGGWKMVSVLDVGKKLLGFWCLQHGSVVDASGRTVGAHGKWLITWCLENGFVQYLWGLKTGLCFWSTRRTAVFGVAGKWLHSSWFTWKMASTLDVPKKWLNCWCTWQVAKFLARLWKMPQHLVPGKYILFLVQENWLHFLVPGTWFQFLISR